MLAELFGRIKGILISPAEEWKQIAREENEVVKLLLFWILPLAAITLIAFLIGPGLIHKFSHFGAGLALGLAFFVLYVAIIFLAALIMNLLAPSFGGKSEFGRALALAAYSFTPVFLIGILYIIPFPNPNIMIFLTLAAFAYGLYIMFCGIGTMISVSKEIKLGFFITSAVIYAGLLCLSLFLLLEPVSIMFLKIFV